MSKLDKILDKIEKNTEQTREDYEDMKDVTPEEVHETEELEAAESLEEVNEPEAKDNQKEIAKGIVIYHDEAGNIHYQFLGQNITLENVIFYKEYMSRIADSEWASANAIARGENSDA